jgi:hypothetical protein
MQAFTVMEGHTLPGTDPPRWSSTPGLACTSSTSPPTMTARLPASARIGAMQLNSLKDPATESSKEAGTGNFL